MKKNFKNNSKKLFIASYAFFAASLLSFPVVSFIFPIVCTRTLSDSCSYNSAMIANSFSFGFSLLFIIIAVILAIIAAIFRTLKK